MKARRLRLRWLCRSSKLPHGPKFPCDGEHRYGGSPAYSSARNYFFGTTTRGPRQSQAWVVTSMFAEGRYAVEMDAAAVGNGCSPAPALSRVGPIAPAP